MQMDTINQDMQMDFFNREARSAHGTARRDSPSVFVSPHERLSSLLPDLDLFHYVPTHLLGCTSPSNNERAGEGGWP